MFFGRMCFVAFSVDDFIGRSFCTYLGSCMSVVSAWVVSLSVAFVRILVAACLPFL
jgi:hypothetical protein